MPPMINTIHLICSSWSEHKHEKKKKHKRTHQSTSQSLSYQLESRPVNDKISQNNPNHSIKSSRSPSLNRRPKSISINSKREDVPSNSTENPHNQSLNKPKSILNPANQDKGCQSIPNVMNQVNMHKNSTHQTIHLS